jgi:hypothetical protein
MVDLFKGLKNFVPETLAELKRLGAQGGMEAANLLFNGQAFVPYGPGQNPAKPEKEQQGQEQDAAGHEQEQGGMER